MEKLKTLGLLSLFLIVLSNAGAQEVFKLWEGQTKPYYLEMWGTTCYLNITEPTLTVYEAQGENTGKAVIVIPGGGYEVVAMHHEGYDVAEILSAKGITAAVLKYRLPNPESSDRPDLVPLSDARRALKLLRDMAGKYGFDKAKVGLMGFSAGSHLATVTSLWKSDDQEENPDYTALIYGVSNLNETNLKWLEESLYFRQLSSEEIKQNSLLDLVSENSVPSFLVHAYDDEVCPVEETTLYARKLYEHKVLVEVHLFPRGSHGFGVGRKEDGTDQWLDLFVNWLKSNEL